MMADAFENLEKYKFPCRQIFWWTTLS